MTEIWSGTVVHWNAGNPPVFDPAGTEQVVVNLPNGSDDKMAVVALVAQYILGLPGAKQAGMLTDASNGLVRVIDLRKTTIP
jgi:hypothetical protein